VPISIFLDLIAPRERQLRTGDIIGLQPRRYRIFR
jgi:hypothetical protein